MIQELTFGQWLKRRRRTLDLTQKSLAERVGCSPETIYKIEAGKRRPSEQIAGLIAQQLNIPEQEHAEFIAFARSTSNPVLVNRGSIIAPWRTQFLPPHNLPLQVTAFIGREANVSALQRQLLRAEVRLLTITGPPGVGKTRLSLQLGDELLLDFPDGVFFVELAPLTNPERVASRIAQTIGIRETSGYSIDFLKQALYERQLLLILDNFEHIMEAAPGIRTLLTGCPLIKIIVTSRAPLRIRGERIRPLNPLVVPSVDGSLDVKQVSEYGAVQMFVDRAQAADPTFRLTTDNADTVSGLCSRVAGLPLAIEIIAARLATLPLSTLLNSLSSEELLLSPGLADMDSRHWTLKAAIDWSYNLLNANEQRFFRGLGVFRKGFTLEAARAVCKSGDKTHHDLSELAKMGLVKHAFKSTDEARFELLEPIREYSLRQAAIQSEAEMFHHRHAQFFLAFAQEAEPELRGADQVRWLEKLELEHDNLQAALEHFQSRKDLESALQMTGSLSEFWTIHSHFQVGLDAINLVLKATRDDHRLLSARAKAANGAAMLANFSGDQSTAYQYAEQAMASAKRAEDEMNIALASMSMGMIHSWRWELDTAESILNQGLEAANNTGEMWLQATLLGGLGGVALHRADYSLALAHYEGCLTLAREIGYLWAQAHTLANIGLVFQARQRYDKSIKFYRESLQNFIQLRDEQGIAMNLEKLGWLSATLERPRRAAILLGSAAVLRKRTNAPGNPDELNELEETTLRSQEQLGEAQFEAGWQEGQEMPLEQAIALALQDEH